MSTATSTSSTDRDAPAPVIEIPRRVTTSLAGYAELYNDSRSPFTVGFCTKPIRHPYRWVIQAGSLPHTAFRTERGLQRWLNDGGLTLPCPIAEIPDRGIVRPSGLLVQNLTYDMAGCLRLEAEGRAFRRKVFDNGDLTDAWVETERDRRVWHILNCNVKQRPVYDGFDTPHTPYFQE